MKAARFFKIVALGFWLLAGGSADAHIGNPTVFFQGMAGSYPIRVTIRPPGVVPGLAQIQVVVTSGDAEKVTVRPVRWDASVKGSPAPDTAVLVPGETNMYSAQLWLMKSGAFSVFVEVIGPRGDGVAIVPLNSIATQRLVMTRGMEVVLLIAGFFVAVLLISVIGAAVRDAGLPPGEEALPINRWRGWCARGITATALVVGLYLGNKWWDSVDKDYRLNRLYRPEAIRTELKTDSTGHRQLELRFSPTSPIDSTPLVVDHGHLMHLFLVRESDGGVFAHLHPKRVKEKDDDESMFKLRLPPLPAGDYELYADITHESGLTQTLTNILSIPAVAAGTGTFKFGDPDDSVLIATPAELSRISLPGGLYLSPGFSDDLRVNQETNLVFYLTTADGTTAALEPYLGMYGHLMIEDSNGTVFNHLHPLGSISMASQRLFAEREQAGYLTNQPLDQFCTTALPELSFPYAFPKAGVYRLWL
ncbi:MAG TPA: hypothetical protein VH619_19090, partial [Verrucomicrobiae bacterium]|nr:hypothetical protein [Verrucomicrobiae bacterium]